MKISKNIAIKTAVSASVTALAVFVLIWLFSSAGGSEIRIDGPNEASVGQLCVFRVPGENRVAWTIVPESDFFADSDGGIAFSSNEPGTYTIVASVKKWRRSVIGQKTVFYGSARRDKKPAPEPNGIDAWVMANAPNNSDERANVHDLFGEAILSISRGTVTTIPGARALIRSKTILGTWSDNATAFFDDLAEQIEKEKVDTLDDLRDIYERIEKALDRKNVKNLRLSSINESPATTSEPQDVQKPAAAAPMEKNPIPTLKPSASQPAAKTPRHQIYRRRIL